MGKVPMKVDPFILSSLTFPFSQSSAVEAMHFKIYYNDVSGLCSFVIFTDLTPICATGVMHFSLEFYKEPPASCKK